MWSNRFVFALILGVLVLTSTLIAFGQLPTYPTIHRLSSPICTTPDPFGGAGKCFDSGYGLPDTVVPPPGVVWNVPQWFLYVGAFRVPKPVPTGFEPKGVWFSPAGNNATGSLFVCTATHDWCIEEMTIPTPVVTTDINAMPMATELAPAGYFQRTGGFGLGPAEPELIFPPTISHVQSRLHMPNGSKIIALVARTEAGRQVVLEYSVDDVQRQRGFPQTVLPYAMWPYDYSVSFSAVSYYTPPRVEPPAIRPFRVFGSERIANTVIIHVFLIG